MSETCLNPKCDNEVLVIGVCVPCANSSYSPCIDGVQVGNIVTDGHKS